MQRGADAFPTKRTPLMVPALTSHLEARLRAPGIADPICRTSLAISADAV
jgi:hypothetical protein